MDFCLILLKEETAETEKGTCYTSPYLLSYIFAVLAFDHKTGQEQASNNEWGQHMVT